MSSFSLTSQPAFGIFEEFDQTHEPLRARDFWVGRSRLEMPQDKIPADDDLGKAVAVTDSPDWNWDRLRVQDGPISSSVRHHRGKQSGAVWERVAPSRRTNDHRTWAFFLSSQSAMQAMLPGLDVPWMAGIRDSTKQGFRVENTSTHSVRE